MKSWSSFCNEVKQLASHHYEWPNEIPLDVQAALSAFDQLCLNRLGDLLLLPLLDDEKEMRVRLFFAMRWAVVANTSLDYTLNPQLPTNQLFLRVAKQIAKSEEAVCSVLMPTIKKVVGSDSPDDIKYASEDLSSQFYPHYFLINAEGTALLSLEAIFSYAIHDTDFLFPVLTESNHVERKIQFDLSAADGERIRKVSTETANLFDYLQENHRTSYEQKPSVGYALKILQLALLKSSKIGVGSDVVANVNECQHPINAFYEIWRALAPNVKNQIGQYKANNSTVTLENYLFCLFAHTSGIALSADEYNRVRGDIVPCTHMIGTQIQIILKQYMDLNNIPLPGMESQFSTDRMYGSDVLEACFLNHMGMLKNPRIMIGEHNRHLTGRHLIFDGLTQHGLDPILFKNSIEAVSLRSMSDFMMCLNMIPQESWPAFLSVLESQCDISYFDLVVLLKGLAVEQWNRFFALIFETVFGDQLDSGLIAEILGEIPESQHVAFIRSIDRYVDSVFYDSIDIFYLLAGTDIHNWPLTVSYFQHRMDIILSNPREMIRLFNIIPCVDWLSLYALFQNLVRQHLASPKFFDLLYQGCVTQDRQAAFISVILNDMDWIVKHPLLLVTVLSHANPAEWRAIFNLITPAHFRQLIETPSDLFRFLHEFKNDDFRCIVIYHLREHLASLAIPSNMLLYLIKSFPECQNLLISIFSHQLPTIFDQFLQYFSHGSQNDISAEYRSEKRCFLFLAKKSLPLLLSHKVIAEQCESFRRYHDDFSESMVDPVFRLYHQLRTVEKKITLQEMSRETASIEKLKLMSEFVRFSKVTGRTVAPFYRELVAFYGENFFDGMLKHCDSLLQVQGVGFFSGNVTRFRAHSVSLIRSVQDRAHSTQRASSVPVQSVQSLFIQGSQIPLQPRGAPQP